MIVIDADSHIVLINSLAETLTGWTQDEVKGKVLEDFFTIRPDITVLSFERLASLKPEDDASNWLTFHGIILRDKDGITRPIELNVTAIRDHEQDVIGNVLIFRDGSQHMKLRRINAMLEGPKDVCSMIQCRRRLAYEEMLNETVAVLVSTKRAFRSKRLAQLRHQVEHVLKGQREV